MANLFWLNVKEAHGIAADGKTKLVTDEKASDFLANIRDATAREVSAGTRPRSIPHPWAKAFLSSEYILMDRNKTYEKLTKVQKELFKSAIGTWRGLMAMLALKEVYDVDVSYEKVEKWQGVGASLMENQPVIAKNAWIRPNMNNQTPIYIVYAKGRAVGMTYPSIIALPGYCPQFSDILPWAKNNLFVDPIKALTRGERMIVYAWLKKAVAFYSQDEYEPLVLRALNDFLLDLKVSPEDKKLAEISVNKDVKVNILKDTVYEPLEMNVALDISDKSEVKIDESQIGIVDRLENIMPDGEKLVVGMLDEIMYQREPALFDKFIKTRNKLEVINSEDVFLDTWCYFEQRDFELEEIDSASSADAISDQHKTFSPNYIHLFPIKAEYARKLEPYFDGDISVSVVGDSMKAVCGFLVNGLRKEIFKTFNGQNREMLNSDCMATTVIWPNIDGCSQYNVIAKWNEQKGLTDAFMFVPTNIELTNSEKGRYQFLVSNYPKHLTCFWNNPNIAGFEEKGIVALTPPQTTVTKGITANYAFDFGTSASIAAYNFGTEEDSNKIDFSNQISLIAATETEVLSANRILFGDYGVTAPYPTIYCMHPGPTEVLFEGGHPYFNLPNKRIDLDRTLRSNIKFDIGDGTDNSKIQEDYIRGILNMMLVHARKQGVSKMNLSVSYPISIANTAEFRGKIEEIVEKYVKIGKKKGIGAYGVELGKEKVKFVSESEAATRFFFLSEEIKESITLDIGGGSADLFAYNDSGKGQAMIASVVAGSRVFLLSLLHKHPEVLIEAMDIIKKEIGENVIENEWFDKKTYMNDKGLEAFFTEVELLFQHSYVNKEGITVIMGNKIGNVIRTAEGNLGSGNLGETLKKMKSIWMMQLAAFFYYGGLMYRKTMKDLGEKDLNQLSILLAGRGSQVIEWLPKGYTNDLLVAITASAMSIDSEISEIQIVRKESETKLEAAVGMLKSPLKHNKTELKEKDFVFDYLIGESYIDKRGEMGSQFDLYHHQSSAARSKKIKNYSDDFSAIDSSLPEISKFFEELNDLIEQGMLKDKLFCIKLSDNAKEASKLNKENDDALYIDKKSLAQAVDNFAKEMKGKWSSCGYSGFLLLN